MVYPCFEFAAGKIGLKPVDLRRLIDAGLQHLDEVRLVLAHKPDDSNQFLGGFCARLTRELHCPIGTNVFVFFDKDRFGYNHH